jgi:hypothetical protein
VAPVATSSKSDGGELNVDTLMAKLMMLKSDEEEVGCVVR